MRPILLLLAVVLLLVGIPCGPSGARGEDRQEMVEVILTEPLRLEDFLKAVGRVTEFPLYWDPGTAAIQHVEVVGARNLRAPRSELFDLLRGLLASYDLVLVPVGPPGYEVYRVMDVRLVGRGACLRMDPEPVALSDDTLEEFASKAGLYVTTTLAVSRGIDLERAAAVLGELATGNGVGQVLPLAEAHALLVTDFAPTVVRIHRALRELDGAAAAPSDWAHVIVLDHLDARAAARALAELLAAPGDDAPSLTVGPVRVAACEARQALLVQASRADFEQVKALVHQLDVPETKPEVWTHVLELEHVQALELALALEELLPAPGDPRPSSLSDSVRVAAHTETNRLLVTATPKDFEQVKALVEQLDRE